MALQTKIQRSRPTSAGRRFVTQIKHHGLHKGAPHKPLTDTNNKTAGRNNSGKITTRHRGGGHKQKYRIIDFKRNKDGIPCTVERIEYDPNRTAHIALVLYKDGERRYILSPKGLSVGTTLMSGSDVEISVGNCLPLQNIPVGTFIHNVEAKPGKGGQYARSAGTSVQLIAKEGKYATIRLRSGEMKKFELLCRATIGEIGNSERNLISLGKAGAKRWRGVRPTVRGVAMNPVDHPHGGGEGRTSGGRHPVSLWGQPTKGKRTRNKKKWSSKLIVRTRHQRKQ